MHTLTVNRRVLGYFPICQLVPQDKHQLSVNERKVKSLKTAKELGWVVWSFSCFSRVSVSVPAPVIFRDFPLRLVKSLIAFHYQVFSQCLLFLSKTIQRGISLSSFLFSHSLQSHIALLCPLESGNGTLLVIDCLHVFLYKSVEFNNCIINPCHVSEITFFFYH